MCGAIRAQRGTAWGSDMFRLATTARLVLLAAGASAAMYGTGVFARASIMHFQLERGTYLSWKPTTVSVPDWHAILNLPPQTSLQRGGHVLRVGAASCRDCTRNMDNILALLEQVQRVDRRAHVVKVSADPDSIRALWVRHLLPGLLVDATIRDTTAFLASVGGERVPATVVLRDGRVEEVSYGLLGPASRQRVITLLAKP